MTLIIIEIYDISIIGAAGFNILMNGACIMFTYAISFIHYYGVNANYNLVPYKTIIATGCPR